MIILQQPEEILAWQLHKDRERGRKSLRRVQSELDEGSAENLLGNGFDIHHATISFAESVEDNATETKEHGRLIRRRSLMSQTSMKKLFKWKTR